MAVARNPAGSYRFIAGLSLEIDVRSAGRELILPV